MSESDSKHLQTMQYQDSIQNCPILQKYLSKAKSPSKESMTKNSVYIILCCYSKGYKTKHPLKVRFEDYREAISLEVMMKSYIADHVKREKKK